MLRGTFRLQTCKIVIFTSLVWILIDVYLIMYFTDRMSWQCGDTSSQKRESKDNPFLLDRLRNIASDKVTVKSFTKGPRSPNGKFVEWQEAVEGDNPSHWMGERGVAVTVGKEEQELKDKQFKLNQFNLLVSDRIALNRTLKDVRMNECKTKRYPNLLPRTSIVIVFHNEAWSTLLRTITSIITRSPRELLVDIILVDDASDREHLKKELEDYVPKFSVPTKVIRMPERSGLIRARLKGAKEAKGQVITFLDAHCECTKGWLVPLLSRIAEDKTRVVSPIIDVISDETFEYVSASDMTWGGFNWRLSFRWYRVPQREVSRRSGDRTIPLRTPTMAGGLFSIDRDYFEYIGKYDEGMQIWGGENLEFSFRIWMCGGTVEIVTCSHVGHVFRKTTPYTFPGGTGKIVHHNNARLAEVWLDEWKDFYYSINPGSKITSYGDVTPRRFLRRKLKCKSFRWYLENIYPESQMPLRYFYLGDIKNAKTKGCLDTYGRKGGENAGFGTCHGLGGNQIFAYTKNYQIMSDDNCLDSQGPNGPVKLVRCHNMGGNQKWIYRDDKTIYHPNTNKCLNVPSVNDKTLPVLRNCDPSLSSSLWVMDGKFKWQLS